MYNSNIFPDFSIDLGNVYIHENWKTDTQSRSAVSQNELVMVGSNYLQGRIAEVQLTETTTTAINTTRTFCSISLTPKLSSHRTCIFPAPESLKEFRSRIFTGEIVRLIPAVDIPHVKCLVLRLRDSSSDSNSSPILPLSRDLRPLLIGQIVHPGNPVVYIDCASSGQRLIFDIEVYPIRKGCTPSGCVALMRVTKRSQVIVLPHPFSRSTGGWTVGLSTSITTEDDLRRAVLDMSARDPPCAGVLTGIARRIFHMQQQQRDSGNNQSVRGAVRSVFLQGPHDNKVLFACAAAFLSMNDNNAHTDGLFGEGRNGGLAVFSVRAGVLFASARDRADTVLLSVLQAATTLSSFHIPCMVLFEDIDILCSDWAPEDPMKALGDRVNQVVVNFLRELSLTERTPMTSFPGRGQKLLVVGCVESGSVARPLGSCLKTTSDAFALKLTLTALPTPSSPSPLSSPPLSLSSLSLGSSPSPSSRLIGSKEECHIPSSSPCLSGVAGHARAKEVLMEVFWWPRVRPQVFREMGVNMPLGVLLYGPPGTGKTLLAKQLASALGGSCISIRLSSVIQGEIGVGEAILRQTFQEARRRAPCLVFVDEMQALFTVRGTGAGSVLTSALAGCLDETSLWNEGAGAGAHVAVLAATNEPWAVDAGLLRGGRLDRVLFVGPLDAAGRSELLRVHLESEDDVDMDEFDIPALSRMTRGYTGADIAYLFRRSSFLALAAGRDRICQLDLEQSAQQFNPSVDPCLMREYQHWSNSFRQR
eukprot:gene964-1872_t